MIFSFGVIEHFLRESERKAVLQKLYKMVKPKGWLITGVPNGVHPKRQAIKAKGLGGYKIPEIDYSVEKLRKELELAGFSKTDVIPWNLFGYLLPCCKNPISRFFALMMGIFRVVPSALVPMKFRERHAYFLIAISQKVEETT